MALPDIRGYSGTGWTNLTFYYIPDGDPVPVQSAQSALPKIKRVGESSFHTISNAEGIVVSWQITDVSATAYSNAPSTTATVDANGVVTVTADGTNKLWCTMTEPSGHVYSSSKNVTYTPYWAVVTKPDGTKTGYTAFASAMKAEVEALAPTCPVNPSQAPGTVSSFLGWVPEISGPVESDVTYTAEFSEAYYPVISAITFTSFRVQGTKVTADFSATFSAGEKPSRYQVLVKSDLNGEKVPVDARISLDIEKQVGALEVDLDGNEYATKAFLVGLSVSDAPDGD